MPRPKFRAIIFDLGRVLVRVDVARAMSRLAANTPLSPPEVWSLLENDPRWRDWQEGRIVPQDWHSHLTTRLGGNLTFEQFSEVWNLALAPEPILSDSLLEELSRRFRLAVLSNTDPLHVAHMEAHFSFLRYFPRRIYSCQVGTSKPDPLIFRNALRACAATAEETVFIDDIPSYVDAARQLGMAGIVFQSPEQLRKDLAAHHIHVPAG